MRWVLTLLVGVLVGALLVVFLRPGGDEAQGFDREAAWELDRQTVQELFECGTTTGGKGGETECALRVMNEEGAPEEAQEFFRQTHWFLEGFRESGVVDLGAVVTPWRANANDDYLLLNGSPSVVSVEREAPVVALFGQEPVYERLREEVNRSDDVPEEDDLVLWESDEVFESVKRSPGKVGFVFQWSLKDACHACDTGYLARVALEFGRDGTYLGAEPMNICWEGGGETERVEDDAPNCPETTSVPQASR